VKPFYTILAITLLLTGLAASAAVHQVASPVRMAARQTVEEGALVYQAKCSSCHQADGSGVAGAFPPLAGNPNAADGEYVEMVVTDGLSGPIEVLGVTYDSVMPPVDLSDDELASVVAYVATLAEGAAVPPTTEAAPTGGDAVIGERLFKGVAGFADGGPACAACHSAGDVGFRGGSGLGPDLTDAIDRLGGEAGLAAWLANPASATMQPLFVDRPLTGDEIGDLTAFLATTTDHEGSGGVDQLLVGGGLGLLALLGLMAGLIRKPNESYNKRLRRRQ